MIKEKVVQSVRDYINDDNAKYAVLINGAWGCGKTYLYENELKDEILKLEIGRKERKCNVYISLYGISTVEQLAKELVTNYILESKYHGDAKRKAAYEQLKRVMGIVSKMFSFSISGLSIDLDNGIKEIKNGIKFGNMIVCLDDFERCSIPIVDMFGMINNLVEHCNCKVIILADENNIGKVYANTNIELKFASLLHGRKIVVEKKAKNEAKDEQPLNCDEIEIEDLKRLNEKVYSENYIYKNMKEKVIGLSLKYTPDLQEEFDSIIDNVVKNNELKKVLKERKEKILEYMNNCYNNNIRIIRFWLINFEKIYNVINKDYTNDKFFDTVLKRFTIYSIRVACAIGKNKKLAEWDDGKIIGFIELDDAFKGFDTQGYKFIDDLYRDALFIERNIREVTRMILNTKQEEEIKRIEKEKLSRKGGAYKKLNNWIYLKDDEIKKTLEDLLYEINIDDYIPQDYQHIIFIVCELTQNELCEEDLLYKISEQMQCKIKGAKKEINIENYQFDFSDNKELWSLFHRFYDPVDLLIKEKNEQYGKKTMNDIIDYSTGENFCNSCKKNNDLFLLQHGFISYINLKKLENILYNGTNKDVYDIEKSFRSIYCFANTYDFYSGDLEQLKVLKQELERFECDEKTKKIAINKLISTLIEKIEEIEDR